MWQHFAKEPGCAIPALKRRLPARPAAFLPQDVPAYVTAFGSPAVPKTVNIVGLKRRGFNKDAILAIKQAYKILYRQGLSLDDALIKLNKLAIQQPEVQLMLDSVKVSSRGIIR